LKNLQEKNAKISKNIKKTEIIRRLQFVLHEFDNLFSRSDKECPAEAGLESRL